MYTLKNTTLKKTNNYVTKPTVFLRHTVKCHVEISHINKNVSVSVDTIDILAKMYLIFMYSLFKQRQV